MAQLQFKIEHQIITRVDDFLPVAKSQNYLRASFTFSEDWGGITDIKAIFRANGKAYEVLLDEHGECVVPWEALVTSGIVKVSAYGGDRITANIVRVSVSQSGYTGHATPTSDPTKDTYEALLERMDEIDEDIVEAVADALTEAKESGEFDGNGIKSIEFNPDYTLTINFTDGTHYTTGNIRGTTGNGIQNVVLNDDYTLTINYTDGNSVTTDPIRGAPGNGISGISFDSQNYTLTINFTDGESFTTGSIRGATGNGIASVRLNPDYTLTITYTDGNSVTTSSIRGAKGDTGLTPNISIGTVSTLAPDKPATAEITGTPENPVLSLGIPKGDKGDSGAPIDDTAGTGDTDKTWSADKIASELENAGSVKDVQVNGTSVVNNGVAEIPKMSTTALGVAKVSVSWGINVRDDGVLETVPATEGTIKLAQNQRQPITPTHQHESTFYGLAKAAGDTTQASSSNAVGTYTDNAKASIKAMLGVGGETQTVNVSGTAPVIVANQNTRYVCGEVTSLDFTPSAEGICDVIFTSGSTVAVLTIPNTVIFPEWFDPTALEANKTYEISISDGVYGAVMVW